MHPAAFPGPHLAQAWVTTSGGEFLPRAATLTVVSHPPQRCATTAFVGTPCAVSAFAPSPLEVRSGAWVATSLHFSQDIGL